MATMEPQAADMAGLFAKMVKVMASMERIPKRGYNTHFKYKFVTDADVLDAVRAAMVKHGIAFFVSFDGAAQRDKGVTTGSFTLTFADAETGATFAIGWVGEGQDTQDKGAAKAVTSAVKYALLKTFLISTGDEVDDPDAGAARKKAKRPAQAKKPAVAATTKLRNTPTQLRDKIRYNIVSKQETIFTYPEGKAANNQIAIISNLEGDCFAGDRDARNKRHAVTWYLTGKESTKDLDDSETAVLHKWLNASKGDDDRWHVDEDACREAHAVYAEAMREMGQTGLFAGEPEHNGDDQERPF